MAVFMNKGNSGFKKLINSEIFVDKTDMIKLINAKVNTENCCICISRPRRFGKTVTANMIGAYYDKGCDSRTLFENKKLAQIADWDKYLNKFDVLWIDVAEIRSMFNSSAEALVAIKNYICDDLRKAFPDCDLPAENIPAQMLASINSETGKQFVIIIDEWDCLFRDDQSDVAVQNDYINLLRGLFKGNASKSFLALAYITGIMPIKRYNSESALNNFYEYTMLAPSQFAPYIGFSTDEVKVLCDKYKMNFDEALMWYDGYCLGDEKHVCGANSITKAMLMGEYASYWSNTVAYDSLKNYITLNFDGLKDAIKQAIGGQRIKVRTGGFQNDMTSFRTKNDVLTLLIHLGYLAYDSKTKEAYIPNREVREYFEETMEITGWDELVETVEDSQALLQATLAMDAEEVAAKIDQSHMQNTSVLKYNDENSLACCVTLAYYTARSEYNIIRELPSGYGFADIVFLPKQGVEKPAMIVELKWKQDADTAIKQIKEKRYVGALKGYTGKMLLVGINYDKTTKKHECVIEECC